MTVLAVPGSTRTVKGRMPRRAAELSAVWRMKDTVYCGAISREPL